MKVKAKCNIKYGQDWIPCGSVIEVSEEEYMSLKGAVDVVADVQPKQPEKTKEPDPVAAGTEETPRPRATPKPRRTSSTKK